jgi:drug/metabolite transporter (DMT)-like permease
MQRRHVVWLVIGVSAVSTSAVLIRAADNVDVPALTIAFYRCAIASAFLVPVAWWRDRRALRSLSPTSRRLLVLSGVALGCHFAAWVSSLSYTSIAASAVLVQTMPVWVALAGPLIGERTSRRGWVGIGIAVMGTAVIALGSPAGGAYTNPVLGDVLAVVGAMFAAAYVVIGRHVRQELSFVAYSASVDVVAATCLAGAMLVSGTPFTGFPAEAWVLFAAMTAGPQFLGHTVFNHLLGELKASVVSVALLAEPVGSTLLAIVIFNERPGVAVLVGAAIVLAGVAVTVLAESVRRPEVLASPEG